MIAASVLAGEAFAPLRQAVTRPVWAHTRSSDDGTRCGDRIVSYELFDGTLLVVVVDIAGHGRACAPLAEFVANDMLSLLYFGRSPGEAVRIADRNLACELRIDGPQFATLFAARIEPALRRIAYVCAGHEGALIAEPDGTHRLLKPSGPVLGVLTEPHFAECYATFTTPSELVVVTDGVLDSRGALGERFGLSGVLASWKAEGEPFGVSGLGPASWFDPARALVEAAAAHGGGWLADDASALVIGRRFRAVGM